MKTMFVVAGFLTVAAVAPSLGDLGTALSVQRQQTVLAEASGPSPNGRDTALAENESSGSTRFGKDSAQLAEASGPSPNGRDTALAENESSGPTRFGRDSAQLAEASGPSPHGRDTALG